MHVRRLIVHNNGVELCTLLNNDNLKLLHNIISCMYMYSSCTLTLMTNEIIRILNAIVALHHVTKCTHNCI